MACNVVEDKRGAHIDATLVADEMMALGDNGHSLPTVFDVVTAKRLRDAEATVPWTRAKGRDHQALLVSVDQPFDTISWRFADRVQALTNPPNGVQV